MSRARALQRRLKESFPAAKTVAADPELRKRWLLGARRAQVLAVAVVLVGLLVFPPVRDWLAELLFTEETGRWFRRRARLSDTGELFASTLSFLYWFGGLGAAAVALVLYAPKVHRAEAPAIPANDAAAVAIQATLAAPGPTGTLAAEPTAASPGPAGPPAASSAASSGQRYVIESELGRGGMGVVFRAVDSVLERAVALKQLPRHLVGDPVLAERFRTEAKVLARLTHPGIVQVFDLVENEQGMFMAMELVHGGSLDALLEARGALPLPELARLGATMAEALAYAHAQGVVHRDFKPGNVLLAADGTPKVTDFGLAKIARDGPKLTQEGAVLGSPAYMSPEQAAGGVAESAADVYSLGVTLYEMATGHCPFEGESIASVLSAHITQPPPVPTSLPPALRELLLALLAKTPEERPADLTRVAAALREL